jgi:predicted aconitase with swiveling domain/8-oxo-dGTP pyrophosphatase MutT (NUDIX family)
MLKGRGISPGKAEGTALVLEQAFSFLGGVDPSTGILTIDGPDESISGRILVFPMGRGSTVGSYVLLDMKRGGNAPFAIINTLAEPIVATGAVMAEIPMVDDVDISLIRTGDHIRVDADSGLLEIPSIEVVHVVTSILRNQQNVLILQRSDDVGSCRRMWAGISGYVELGETPEKAAFREISEEVGIDDPILVKEGEPIIIRNDDMAWIVHPFLFDIGTREITTDWEHVDHAWISPIELGDYFTVPGLHDVFRRLELL